ncbi:hypothetical protein TrispH2_006613 [Trichoplax sp. H2]|nr:hypothetical protein TrispH2_006613 [Trichoplax sp. H2]|eukprot:RDD42758.1 hypothetical protein TrispH2_006613 [Trichoplax sp. H2]
MPSNIAYEVIEWRENLMPWWIGHIERFLIRPTGSSYNNEQNLHFMPMCDFLIISMTGDLGRLIYEFRETSFITSMVQFTDWCKGLRYFVNFNPLHHSKPSMKKGIMNSKSSNKNELSINQDELVYFYNYSTSDRTLTYGQSLMTKPYGYFPSKCVSNGIALNEYNNL